MSRNTSQASLLYYSGSGDGGGSALPSSDTHEWANFLSLISSLEIKLEMVSDSMLINIFTIFVKTNDDKPCTTLMMLLINQPL